MVNSAVKSIQVNFRFIFYNRYGVREAYRSGFFIRVCYGFTTRLFMCLDQIPSFQSFLKKSRM